MSAQAGVLEHCVGRYRAARDTGSMVRPALGLTMIASFFLLAECSCSLSMSLSFFQCHHCVDLILVLLLRVCNFTKESCRPSATNFWEARLFPFTFRLSSRHIPYRKHPYS